MKNNVTIENFKRIVIVAYRLPYKIEERNKEKFLVQNSGGLVSAILSLANKMGKKEGSVFRKIVWVGHSEHTKTDFDRLSNQDIEFELNPVNIPEKVNTDYYEGFCNDVIWPLFHYFTMSPDFKESYYEAYTKSNQLFMDSLEKVIQPNDLIWVHDYQLFLLPQLIRNRFPKSNIGFFLHIPFPSFEIFRLLNKPWREELLKGILGADLIGFHTNDYCQHFLYTVKRILGFENNLRKIHTPERVVKADVFPIGIDYDKFNNALKSEEVNSEIQKNMSIIGDSKLIFSLDRLDYTKGLMNKLMGYEKFLDKNPQWHEKVIYNMVIIPSRDNILQYRKMKKEIEATVGRINGKFSNISWRPIVYQYKSLNFVELVALYGISHCGLITPLRDGMNLVAKEFVTCQGVNIGVLILSEMAGAVAELGESIIINPSDTSEIADAVLAALEMPLIERKERIIRMKRRIKNYTVFEWTNDFITQLLLIKNEQIMFDVKLINTDIFEKLEKSFRNARKRLILLDYDGTLIPFSKYPENALPSKRVLQQLTSLASDERNSIVIISGRDKKFLEKCFGNIKVNLVAEHGVFYKMANEKWKTLENVNLNTSWKSEIYPIFERYTSRCNGSFIEEKETALVWHFRNAEIDFAFVRANELKEELNELLLHHKHLQLLEGNKIIEVKINNYDKGSAAKYFLNSHQFEFILAIGDDFTDEELFKALPDEAFTIKVGLIQSNAKYNLTRQYEVNDLIDRLL